VKDRVHVLIGGHDDKRGGENAAAVRQCVQGTGSGRVRRGGGLGGQGGDVARHQRQRRTPLASIGAGSRRGRWVGYDDVRTRRAGGAWQGELATRCTRRVASRHDTVAITWPSAALAELAAFTRELLR